MAGMRRTAEVQYRMAEKYQQHKALLRKQQQDEEAAKCTFKPQLNKA
jgi:hypothetical protein